MAEWNSRANEVFLEAAEIESPAERRRFLDQQCGDDMGLRAQVEALLAASAQVGSFLNRPAVQARPGDYGTVDYQPSTEGPGTVIGPYKLLQQIGEGGMGTVFMAEQTQPVQRRVALKIIKPGMDSRQVIARFEAERQALAMMDHQNIARVLDAGATNSGRPYFVMELVQGVSITAFCDSRKLTPRDRLELFVPVCQALQHAHQKGIIHRDVKPSNVLVTMYDDKPVPKVIDFGVAKAIEQRLTDKTMFTQFGTLVGTFEYMSPEQADMNAFGVDTRSDIYSLGVLLYELLTGTTPLEKQRLRQAALNEMVRLIKEEEAPRPSDRLSSSNNLPKIAAARNTEPARLSKLIKGDIDWIVMKCLEKDRTRRYESASGLARDIERALADEPVEACPPSATYRLRKFARRYKTPLRVACAFVLLLVLGVIASTWQAFRATWAENAARASEETAQNRKREADEAKEKAEQQRDELRRQKYIADMNLAHHAWAESNLIRTRELLELHRPRPGEPDLRGFEWHYLRRLFQGELQVMQAHTGMATAIAFTSDGKRLVSCGVSQQRPSLLDGKEVPREMKLWDVATGRQLPLGLQGPTDKVRWVAISPDGTRLAAACVDQGIRLWDLATGQQRTLPRHAKEIDVSVSFSPDGKRLVVTSMPAGDYADLDCIVLRVWDLGAATVLTTVAKLPYTVIALQFSPDGKLLAFADSSHRLVRVFDAATGQEAFSCKYAQGYVSHVVFSPDGKRLAACGHRGIQLWDSATRAPVATWPSTSALGFLAYSPDGKVLAVGSIEGALELWDAGTGQKLYTFNGQADIRMVAFSPDGTRLVSAGRDGALRVWDPSGRREALPLSESASEITWVILSPDAKAVLTLPGRKSIRLWDAATGEPCGDEISMEKGPQTQRVYDWTADGKRLFIGDDQHIKVYDVATSKLVRALPVDADDRSAFAVSPDGKWCAHSLLGGAIKVRDAATGAESRTIMGIDDLFHYLAFSPDGSRLLGVASSGVMKIWDRATGRETAATRLKNVYVNNIRFSTDGKRLAVVGHPTQSLAGAVRVLDAESGHELLALKGHTVNVFDADFSPDGQRLATCSADRTVRLWDLAAGQEILTLRGPTVPVHSVRFVSDGHRLISASADRTVRIWDATPLP